MASITTDDVKKMKVPELRKFLKSRNVTCGEATKAQLVELSVLTLELDVRAIADDDYEKSLGERRTVIDGGRQVVLPDPNVITQWESSLKMMPKIDIADVFVYLISHCCWSTSRMKKYRYDRGYRLYKDGNIIGVQLHPMPDVNHLYVMGDCVRETSVREKPYKTWLLLSEEGDIVSGGCTCVAEHGSCKHCVALLFSLQDFSDRHCDRHTATGTDVPCYWDRPRQESRPLPIDDINIGHSDNSTLLEPTLENFNPLSCQSNISDEQVLQEIHDFTKHDDCQVNEVLDPVTDATTFPLQTIPQLFNDFKSKQSNQSDFIKFLQENITSEYITQIQSETISQRNSLQWYAHRVGRITASKAGDILKKCNASSSNFDGVVSEILGNGRDLSNVKAVKFGLDSEPVAKQLYFTEYLKNHKNARMNDIGLCVHEKYPMISASPDGVVSCECCGEGLCECKASHKHRHSSPLDAARDPTYHNVYADANDCVKLNRRSLWYVQIQVQLACTMRKWVEVEICEPVIGPISMGR
ncbi:uncharacterized protein [Ptychodera flava]|uniref:uncharacterized protein n=2 Tax=Ptychodera flava TaxID=63121 RepID=UPI00396A151F